MIDISDDVYNLVRTTVDTDALCGSDNENIPARFPYVCCVTQDNSTYTETCDSGSIENHCTVMVQIDVYTNDVSGKKDKAKTIIKKIDVAMLDAGFARTLLQPISYLQDATVYRLTSRYDALVDKNKTLYRR